MPKRKATSAPAAPRTRRRVTRRPRRTRKRSGIARVARSVMLRMCETKKGKYHHSHSLTYNTTVYQGGFLSLTDQGTKDPDQVEYTGIISDPNYDNRIGDEIFCLGIRHKFVITFESPSFDGQVRLFCFKYNRLISSLSDSNFWNGYDTAGSAMDRRMDTVNQEHGLKLLKTLTYRPLPHAGATQKMSVSGSVWVPINKKVKYDNGTATPLWFNHGLAMIAHNEDKLTGVVANVDCVSTLYYKDP